MSLPPPPPPARGTVSLNSVNFTQDPHHEGERIILVQSLVEGGVAERDGGLRVGDRLVTVNDVSLINTSLQVQVLVHCTLVELSECRGFKSHLRQLVFVWGKKSCLWCRSIVLLCCCLIVMYICTLFNIYIVHTHTYSLQSSS